MTEKPKIGLEGIPIAVLQYLREYRTDEQIAADFGIHETHETMLICP